MAARPDRILLVEDDDLVREFTHATLTSLGYDALAVSDGAAALEILENDSHFDLLLTDVILGGPMNGRQVADASRSVAPGIRVLYMSGYTENVIVHNGRLDPGTQLLVKPFRRVDIASKIREVLNGRA